jgi:hypothetical protein
VSFSSWAGSWLRSWGSSWGSSDAPAPASDPGGFMLANLRRRARQRQAMEACMYVMGADLSGLSAAPLSPDKAPSAATSTVP